MPTNPFSTRYTEPGAVAYLFPQNVTASGIVECFITLGKRCQIVAPHGSGKSTLIQTLLPLLREHFDSVSLQTLHDNQRHLDKTFWREIKRGNNLAIIDGYEQLSFCEKQKVNFYTKSLLITLHKPIRNLPILSSDTITIERFKMLLTQLCNKPKQPPLPEKLNQLIENETELSKLLTKHKNNCREVFFELYDIAEGE
ncbi:MAG: hypothetical protein LBU65_04565 [Planctomycetaceae bacterium]|jgi:ABC-type dipeptide/oligopeptide/nickel transport system ATPase component|nr:hypothetical protein [Planctomycetaceae bacterium]